MGFIYNGYLLRSKSAHIAESDRWTMEVSVVQNKDSKNEMREQTFSSDTTFSTKEMADMEGILFARKIIDGEITGISIDN